MDEITPIKIYSGEFPTTETEVAQVPQNVSWIISDIEMCNTSASPANIQIWLTADEEATAVSNTLFAIQIPAGISPAWKGFQIMEPTDVIKIISDIADVSIRISGGEIG